MRSCVDERSWNNLVGYSPEAIISQPSKRLFEIDNPPSSTRRVVEQTLLAGMVYRRTQKAVSRSFSRKLLAVELTVD